MDKSPQRMTQLLRTLIVEDSEDDSELLVHCLRKGGFIPDYRRVETEEAFRDAVVGETWDIIFADFALPKFDADRALDIVGEIGIETPFIVISGVISMERAVRLMNVGAHDFIEKDDLARLVPAVERALSEAKAREQKNQAEKMLREGEKRFKDFAEASADWFWEVDAEGRFTWFSVDRHPMTGDPTSQLIGKRPGQTSLVDLEKAAELKALFADSLARRVPFRGFRSRVKSSDGTMFDLSLSGVPFVDDSGAFRGIRGCSTDITAQVRAEEQLRQALKMEAVGQLTGGIAHDLNNILSVVLGNLELMARLLPDEDGDDDRASPRALNDNAVRATTRGAQLSHRLLAFARKQPLDPREIDVGEVVDGMHDMIRRTVSENIDIRIERRDGAPAYADPSQLENALLNLVINARDAMLDGGSLTIETADTTIAPGDPETTEGIAPGAYVAVSVSDTGTGIPEELRSRVFEPFFTTKEVGSGSGLGLSMVHGFARQSGGTVDIRSSSGHGTSVRILLPTTVPEDARPDAGEPGPAEFELGGNGEVILLVEDDAPVRDSTQAILEALGYVVLTAEDGPSAIATLKRSRDIDLLLTDMVMPGGLTGAMLASQARAERPGLKVVFVSGYVGTTTLPDIAVSNGADSTAIEFIRKPFTIDTLARELRRALNG